MSLTMANMGAAVSWHGSSGLAFLKPRDGMEREEVRQMKGGTEGYIATAPPTPSVCQIFSMRHRTWMGLGT